MAPAQNSIWHRPLTRPINPPLAGTIATDVLVIGGGMCGLLIAHKLKEAGLRCIVAEASTVGSGITKNTTAKITAQHGLLYAVLIRRFGVEKARQYYEANTRAIGQYRVLAAQYLCDFEDRTAYIYSVDDRRRLENEAEAYQKLGIPAQFDEKPPLPLKTVGALGMENQAQFHPLKLLYALAEGLEIYENTFINKIDGDTAISAHGKIRAKHIVMATHYPMVNIPGLYFMKLYQHRSYVIALEGGNFPAHMYLDENDNGYSFRTYNGLLFVGGGSHKTGKKGGGFDKIQNLAGRAYPNAAEKYRWAAQDCMTLDKLPYIGLHKTGSKGLYVATGFNKWGMTGCMVAALLLHNLIVQGKSDLEELYSPQRSMLSVQLIKNLSSAAKGLLSIGGPRCAHMGCKLHKNVAEGSWDCSCHGSRFDEGGNVIDNPAKRGIKL